MVLKTLKQYDEGEHDLPHNSMVVVSSDINIGNKHKFDDMPIFMAGNAGGQVPAGRHLRYDDVTLNNLWVSVLNLAGMPAKTFGADGTGPLPGLAA